MSQDKGKAPVESWAEPPQQDDKSNFGKKLGNALILFALVGGILKVLPLLPGSFFKEFNDALGYWVYVLAAAAAAAALIAPQAGEIPLNEIGEFVAVVGAAYFVSSTLARLSGTALWIPAELRHMVNLLVALVGEAVFNYCRNRKKTEETQSLRAIVEKIESGLSTLQSLAHKPKLSARAKSSLLQLQASLNALGDLQGEEGKRPDRLGKVPLDQMKQKFYARGLRYFLLAIAFFCVFMGMRARCVKGFDVRDWLANQKRDNDLDKAKKRALPEEIEVYDSDRGDTDPSSGEKSSTRTIKMAAFEYYVPEFVDIDRQQVYLPLWFPLDVRKKLCDNAARYNMSGLTYMLSYEPNDLFDDVEHEAAIQVATSNIIFLILDVVIVALAGAGLGWTFDPASAIGDLISS